ncbi:MAG: plasmid pRiA4b ORF-3 family protein [Gammaproteobacteria bacterium]|nr:plasmid pRiA4b ORF-3 family protein [Gammaproteobacteria bacterium]
MKKKLVYRFRIELEEIEPLIWRTIEVPSMYSFWDLHVAIQDSMGWLDYHLHSFSILPRRKRKPVVIGIPAAEYEEEISAGWEVPLNEYFKEPGDEARYEYDFGDGWIHRVLMEGILLAEEHKQYPSCDGGERACPPEDCGGIPGYYHLLEVLAGKHSSEYEDMNEWLKGHAKNYYPYDPAKFDSKSIKFWNPKKRWKMAFEGES